MSIGNFLRGQAPNATPAPGAGGAVDRAQIRAQWEGVLAMMDALVGELPLEARAPLRAKLRALGHRVVDTCAIEARTWMDDPDVPLQILARGRELLDNEMPLDVLLPEGREAMNREDAVWYVEQEPSSAPGRWERRENFVGSHAMALRFVDRLQKDAALRRDGTPAMRYRLRVPGVWPLREQLRRDLTLQVESDLAGCCARITPRAWQRMLGYLGWRNTGTDSMVNAEVPRSLVTRTCDLPSVHIVARCQGTTPLDVVVGMLASMEVEGG